jgi:hypothetical protein
LVIQRIGDQRDVAEQQRDGLESIGGSERFGRRVRPEDGIAQQLLDVAGISKQPERELLEGRECTGPQLFVGEVPVG